MKKILFLTALSVIMLYPADAQLLKYGIKGGINSTTFKPDEFATSEYSVEILEEAKVGYHAGLFFQVNFFSLFLRPELVFTSMANELKVEDLLSGQPDESEIVEQKFNRLDLPVLAGMKFGPLRVGAGPVASVTLSSKSGLADISGYEEKVRDATFGFQVGAGLDVLMFSLDARYESNLSKLGDGVNIQGQEVGFDMRPRMFIVSLGIAF